MHTPQVQSRLRVGLGTFVAVEAEASDRALAARAIEAAYQAIASVERLMHPHRAGSDLSALAFGSAGGVIQVHPWTFQVLLLCRRLHIASSGVFDPCVSDAPGRFSDLELGSDRSVASRRALRLDLGGIAKGFAVDRAIAALRAAGCSAGLVNAGGDLAAFGSRTRDILCPSLSGTQSVVRIQDAALATSDTRASSRPCEHRGYYHGLDRQAPVQGRVTVRAATAALADGLTKCLLPSDRTQREHLAAAFGASLIV
jgi:FAD:protein FMN transferase